MQQQKMKKNKLYIYSKAQSSTILTSTDENFSQNQSRLQIDPKKKNLVEKIKNLQQALNQTNKEYSMLLQKQNYLMNILHGKKEQLELMNFEVGQLHLHNHIKTKVKGCRKHGSIANDRNSTQTQMSNNQQNFRNLGTTRDQTIQNIFPNKSRNLLNNEKMKISFKYNFKGQKNQFTRSYFEKNGPRQITNERKIANKNFDKFEMKFESIEQIWNNQSIENKKTYSKPTKRAQNQSQY